MKNTRLLALTLAGAIGAAAPSPTQAIPPPVPEDAEAKPYRKSMFADVFPTFRLMFGSAWLGRDGGFDGGVDAGFAFDMKAGLLLGRDDGDVGFILWPELGYSHASHDTRGRELFTAGIGFHVGEPLWSVGVSPTFVAGSVGDAAVVGYRTALTGRFFAFTAEFSHTLLGVESGGEHELRATFGVDLIMLVGGFIIATMSGEALSSL
jgi:hypothetical protein